MVLQEAPPRLRRGFVRRGMNFETVASEIWMPSFSNSPWMRGAPHRLAVAMRLMSARTSGSMVGRPPLGRLRHGAVPAQSRPVPFHAL